MLTREVWCDAKKHAAKIYTRNMFGKFVEALFYSGYYDVDEISAEERGM
jgi:hypothetical protein